MAAPRVRTLEEVGEDVEEIKDSISKLSDKLDQRFVSRELYEAKHEALRHEVAREFAALKAAVERGDAASEGRAKDAYVTASNARTLAMWCLGVLAVAVIGAMVGILSTGGPQ
jgi:predicted metal-dependent phosphoesterase TrpH